MIAEVENVAAEIKRHFYNCKREQLGKPYSPAPRMRKPEYWTAAAEKCIEMKASPYDWIRAAFNYNKVPGGPFAPALSGQAAAGWYRQLMAKIGAKEGSNMSVAEQEIQELMLRGVRLITSHNRRMRGRDYLLDDYYVRTEVLPAYIRIFMFKDDPKILERWGLRATEELNSNPDLIEAAQRLGYPTEFTKQY